MQTTVETKVDYRAELAKMLKYLRKANSKHYCGLNRPSYRATYTCSNGQDAEAMYLREDTTVGELKKFLSSIPDDLFLDAELETDYDNAGDIILKFTYNKSWDDRAWYVNLKKHYDYELAKEKTKDIPIPTEEEYHEMLAKIQRYADANIR